jgi:hypothetical protein
MHLLWQKAGIGIFVALCAASVAAGQDSIVAPIMRTQVRPAIAPLAEDLEDQGGEVGQFDDTQDGAVQSIAWLQQPGRQPSLATSQPTARRAATASRLASTSLASVPNMFGDLAGATSILRVIEINSPTGAPTVSNGTVSLPAAGGGSRIGKIAENDSPIPQDRIFFSYNHFHNVFELSETPVVPPGPTFIRQQPLDRYTIGLEKTFWGGDASVELRMPLIGTFDTQSPSFGIDGGNVGNLTVVLKSLLFMDDTTAVGVGMAIETPTGSDLVTRLGPTRIRFENEATHLLPYIGFVWSPGDPRWGWGSGLFLSGFGQVDINASSNTINVVGPNGLPAGSVGRLTDQNLGFLDIAAGYWLFRDSYAPRLTGVAAITELHYTTTLQDVDRTSGTANGTAFALNSTGNRFDVLNGTVGLQVLMFDASSLRVAGVFPLGNEDRRLFDSEVQVQFNRRF